MVINSKSSAITALNTDYLFPGNELKIAISLKTLQKTKQSK